MVQELVAEEPKEKKKKSLFEKLGWRRKKEEEKPKVSSQISKKDTLSETRQQEVQEKQFEIEKVASHESVNKYIESTLLVPISDLKTELESARSENDTNRVKELEEIIAHRKRLAEDRSDIMPDGFVGDTQLLSLDPTSEEVEFVRTLIEKRRTGKPGPDKLTHNEALFFNALFRTPNVLVVDEHKSDAGLVGAVYKSEDPQFKKEIDDEKNKFRPMVSNANAQSGVNFRLSVLKRDPNIYWRTSLEAKQEVIEERTPAVVENVALHDSLESFIETTFYVPIADLRNERDRIDGIVGCKKRVRELDGIIAHRERLAEDRSQYLKDKGIDFSGDAVAFSEVPTQQEITKLKELFEKKTREADLDEDEEVMTLDEALWGREVMSLIASHIDEKSKSKYLVGPSSALNKNYLKGSKESALAYDYDEKRRDFTFAYEGRATSARIQLGDMYKDYMMSDHWHNLLLAKRNVFEGVSRFDMPPPS